VFLQGQADCITHIIADLDSSEITIKVLLMITDLLHIRLDGFFYVVN